MLDIKYIRENLEKVKKAARDKNRRVELDRLLELDTQRRSLIQKIEEKRKIRNQESKINLSTQAGNQEFKKREEGKKLKEEIRKLEEELRIVEEEYHKLMLLVPNVPDESVPVGKDEKGNQEIKRWGEIPRFSFRSLDHITLAKNLDLVDFERGVKVAGSRSYFLKNEGALLELAVLIYTFQKLVKKGYTPLIAPSLIKEFCLLGCGQLPWGKDDVYYLEKDDLYLSGTAEQPVTSYFANEILKEKDLPKKFVAFSPCFRREAGSYGKDVKGLYRLHQFNKVEQVIITTNDYHNSLKLHQELLHNAEEVLQDLKLPYRVVLMCTGEMGEPQVKKYDLETWMPSRNAYGETMSNSFMGDFQSRRLNIRYRTKDGMIKYVHTLNNTAVASPRILIAILENYQQKNGTISIPEVLRNLVGCDYISSKSETA